MNIFSSEVINHSNQPLNISMIAFNGKNNIKTQMQNVNEHSKDVWKYEKETRELYRPYIEEFKSESAKLGVKVYIQPFYEFPDRKSFNKDYVQKRYYNCYIVTSFIPYVMKKLKQQGYSLPKNIRYDASRFYRDNVTPALSSNGDKTIFLNPVYDWKTNIPIIEHIIRHETAHVLHEKKIGSVKTLLYYFFIRSKGSEKELIQKELGKYSTASPLEFVANVFALHTSGIKFPDEIYKIYDKYGGPNLNKHKTAPQDDNVYFVLNWVKKN